MKKNYIGSFFITTYDAVKVSTIKKCNLFNYTMQHSGNCPTFFYFNGKYISELGREIINIVTVHPGICQ